MGTVLCSCRSQTRQQLEPKFLLSTACPCNSSIAVCLGESWLSGMKSLLYMGIAVEPTEGLADVHKAHRWVCRNVVATCNELVEVRYFCKPSIFWLGCSYTTQEAMQRLSGHRHRCYRLEAKFESEEGLGYNHPDLSLKTTSGISHMLFEGIHEFSNHTGLLQILVVKTRGGLTLKNLLDSIYSTSG